MNIDKRLKGVHIGTDVYKIIINSTKTHKLTQEEFIAITTCKGVGFRTLGIREDIGAYIPSKQEEFSEANYCYIVIKYSLLLVILEELNVIDEKYLLKNAKHNKYIKLFFDGSKSYTTIEDLESEVVIPTLAMSQFQKQLNEVYTKDEIKECLSKHQASDDNIMHINPTLEENTIVSYSNVKYVDINKTYGYGLLTIFPRLESWIKNKYATNKKVAKPFFNYTVGMMNNKTWLSKQQDAILWKNARHWITHMCSEKMLETMCALNGEVLYLNTDGVMINNPQGSIETSQELGAFKDEIVDNHKVWFAKVNVKGYAKYSVLQYYENGKKVVKSLGGFQQDEELLKHCDLSKGIVPLYTTSKFYDCKVCKFVKEIKLNEKNN